MTIDNFVGSLVEMAKAYEELPKVQAELADARAVMDDYLATIQRLELKLLDRANEIAQLNAKVLDLEVSRDDAELRFLESEDKLGRVLTMVRGMGETLGLTVANVKAEATPEPVPAPVPEVGPGNYQTDPAQSYEAPPASFGASPEPEVSPIPDPIVPSAAGDGPSSETATPIPSAETGADASSPQSETDPATRFRGRSWSEVPPFERPDNRHEWIAGGGSEMGWLS